MLYLLIYHLSMESSLIPFLSQFLKFFFAFKVIYKVLDPAIHVKDPYSLDIQGQWRFLTEYVCQ